MLFLHKLSFYYIYNTIFIPRNQDYVAGERKLSVLEESNKKLDFDVDDALKTVYHLKEVIIDAAINILNEGLRMRTAGIVGIV